MNNRTANLTTTMLTRVFDGERLDPPPIWLMRQAGRYLPEYRSVREKAGSFLDLCFNPKLASEVTLQPISRFDFDAAIVFSDILVVPYALGREVTFVAGEGPRLEPIDVEAISSLGGTIGTGQIERVYDTLSMVRSQLASEKSLIGFCGAPWTVSTYMVAGRGTPDQGPARLMAAAEPDAFQMLIDRLVSASAQYLVGQLRAGADVVQIFDSWSGVLGEDEFERWCIAPAAKIVSEVRKAMPAARIIGFPKGAGRMIERYVNETGVDGVGVDWTVPLTELRQRLDDRAVIQGNLDPLVLLAGGEALNNAVDRILERLGGSRFIFNLGHGIVPQTPIAHVEQLVARVRGW